MLHMQACLLIWHEKPSLCHSWPHVELYSSSIPVEPSPSPPLLLSQHASDRGFGSSAIFNTAMFTACCFWNRVLPGLSTCLRDCCPHSPSLFLDKFQIWYFTPDLPQLKPHPSLFFPQSHNFHAAVRSYCLPSFLCLWYSGLLSGLFF